MRQSEAKEFLPLIQAWADGKTIQVNSLGGWVDSEELVFNWPATRYRIKPEPRTFYAVEWGDFPVPSIADGLENAKHLMSTHTKATRLLTLREVLDD